MTGVWSGALGESSGSLWSPTFPVPSTACLSLLRRWTRHKCGLSQFWGRGRRAGPRAPAEQEERDLPQGGHQHHESLVVPAPLGESLGALVRGGQRERWRRMATQKLRPGERPRDGRLRQQGNIEGNSQADGD